jgi:hypothetical protein
MNAIQNGLMPIYVCMSMYMHVCVYVCDRSYMWADGQKGNMCKYVGIQSLYICVYTHTHTHTVIAVTCGQKVRRVICVIM